MCLCHVILGFFFFFFNHLFCCSILTILEKNFLYFSLFTFCICVCHVIQSSIIRYRVWFLQHLAHYKSIRSSCCINYVILPHQMPTLLFYNIILQHLIYQMFYNSILYIKIIFTIH